MRIFPRWDPDAYALLRLVAGLMFAVHGSRKLFGWPGDGKIATSALSIIAGWIEVVCGVLIAIGFLAGWAAFLASGTMAVAYFLSHASRGFWPIENGGELAVLYCFLWLYVAARGGGWKTKRARTHRESTSPSASLRE